jgi:hypothetical protein
MELERFDALARDIGSVSRRAAVGVLAAGLAGLRPGHEAASRKRRRRKKKKGRCKPNCVDRSCGPDGCKGSCGTCGAGEVCARGECCVPEPKGVTCAGRCGSWRNNCGQFVECATCGAGQVCLSNGSCAITCTTTGDCNICSCSNPDVEGDHHCIGAPLAPIVPCKSTTDCPPGSHCQDIGSGGLCIELCA